MQYTATRDDFMKSVAFTGYRPVKLPFGYDFNHPDAVLLRAAIKNEYRRLISYGFNQFLTGGALGCDMMAAEVILELKEEYPRSAKISHWLCMPCYDYTAKWKEADRERLKKIANQSHAFYVSDKPYFNGCMQVRNEYMVNTSRVLVAVYDGKPGGTRNTVEYARSKNRKIIVIDPRQSMRIELVETPEDVQLLLNDNMEF